MKRAAVLAIALALTAWTASAPAATRDDLTTPGIAARVAGEPIPLEGLRVLHRVAARDKMTVPLHKVLASVIDNRLLGNYAAANYTEAQLFPNTRIAFGREVAIEDQLIATLRRAFAMPLERALTAQGGLKRFVTQQTKLDPAQLKAVFAQRDGLRLDDSLSPAQLALAAKLPLLSYRLPGGKPTEINLREVWLRQNVQGRTLLGNLDADYAQQQAMQLLAGRFVQHWARHEGKLSDADMRWLRSAIEDRDRRGALLQVLGIEADMHYDSAHLKSVANAVTIAEVRAYYDANKAEFKRVEKVRARHIRCANEACGEAASKRLAAGEAFAEVARSLSQAADREQGGDLGWLVARDGEADWLQQLVFALPPGKPSRPVKSPASDGHWEIVLVDERIEGFQPVDSESVRYAAAQSIARKKVVESFNALREQLYRDNDIQLNRVALGFGSSALKAARQTEQ